MTTPMTITAAITPPMRYQSGVGGIGVGIGVGAGVGAGAGDGGEAGSDIRDRDIGYGESYERRKR